MFHHQKMLLVKKGAYGCTKIYGREVCVKKYKMLVTTTTEKGTHLLLSAHARRGHQREKENAHY